MDYIFENVSAKQKKELVLEYQKTKDRRLFENLIIIYDHYLIYVIGKLKRRFSCLRKVEDQELYHVSIIAMEQSFCSLHEDRDENKVTFWIESYVKERLMRTFAHKKNYIADTHPFYLYGLDNQGEHLCENYAVSKENTSDFIDAFNVRDLLDSDVLTPREKEFVKLKYYDRLQLPQLSEKFGVGKSRLKQMNIQIKNKLRKYLQEGL